MRVLVIDPVQSHIQKERSPEGPLSFFFALDLPGSKDYDLLVLPAGLLLSRPDIFGRGIPLIAYGPVDQCTDAFAGGCSDYLREPWRMDELEARALRFWRLRFDLGGDVYRYSMGRLEGASGSLLLPEGERVALELLLHRLGKPVPRAAFERAVDPGASPGASPGSRVLDMTISRLRRRLESVSKNSQAGSFLGAVRNYGYRLDGKPCA